MLSQSSRFCKRFYFMFGTSSTVTSEPSGNRILGILMIPSGIVLLFVGWVYKTILTFNTIPIPQSKIEKRCHVMSYHRCFNLSSLKHFQNAERFSKNAICGRVILYARKLFNGWNLKDSPFFDKDNHLNPPNFGIQKLRLPHRHPN